MSEPAHDALEALRARLAETRAQAERLADEVAAARAAAQEPAEPGDDPAADERRSAPGGSTMSDLQAIAALLESLRDVVPPELQRQLAEVTRQILLLLRALIDVWVDRLEPPAEPAGGAARGPGPAPEPAVRDIPVD